MYRTLEIGPDKLPLRRRIFWRSFALMLLLIIGITMTAIFSQTRNFHNASKTFYVTQAQLMTMQLPDQILWNDKIGLLQRLQRTVDSDSAIAYAYLSVNGSPLVHTFDNGFPQDLVGLSTPYDKIIAYRTIIDQDNQIFDHIMTDIATTQAVLHFGLRHSELNRRAWQDLQQILTMAFLALCLGAALSCQIAHVTTSEVEEATIGLYRERRFLQSVIDGVVDPIRVLNTNKEIIMLNRSAQTELGNEDCLGEKCRECDNGNGNNDNECPFETVRRTQQPVRILQHRRDKEDTLSIYEIEASPLINNGQFDGMVSTARNITDRLRLEASLDEKESRLLYMSNHDLLTNLPNRVLFRNRLNQAIARNHEGSHVVLLFIGLDRFTKINESLGREIGDNTLTQAAERFHNCLAENQILARLGGDEFAVIMEDCRHPQDAAKTAKKLLEQLTEPIHVQPNEIYLTASIGISSYPQDGESPKTLMSHADIAMTRAKSEGKDRYQFFEREMTQTTKRVFELENDLRKAVARNELRVYYQPQIQLDSQQITGMEALVRWQHPQRGLISPADFIPLAEETGLIVSIGEWVLRQACQQVAMWHDQGLPAVTVAVNLSPLQFRHKALVRNVAKTLKETGINPACLELEVTESMIMDSIDKSTATMIELTELGAGLAIDDFGTGYSSLSYLRYFPLTKLKIDKSFIERVTSDEHDAALATSVIALAHSLNLKVVAEGIEHEDQVQFLVKRSCHQGQGFLFSRPVPAEDMEQLLRQIQ
ncbi:EAL domain-containing protein [Desulfuromonas acetoxidans]|uniref:putative bifunctional diguanylate cyclase/phosphodiesterase n=1 Tax=Desulfuromonas acetoxidans TaxID=891 RepID=UPI002930AC94|nr:EAL domain-containing protein [Desulfuromonas acetoxidans]